MFEPATNEQPSESTAVAPGTDPLAQQAEQETPTEVRRADPNAGLPAASEPSDKSMSLEATAPTASSVESTPSNSVNNREPEMPEPVARGAAAPPQKPSTPTSAPGFTSSPVSDTSAVGSTSFIYVNEDGLEVRRPNPALYRDERPAFARVKVSQARLGNEPLKPLTYFPIEMEPSRILLNREVPAGVSPDLPVAPHHTLMSWMRMRDPVKWEAKAKAVDRRYSELVDFRNLLSGLYPMLVIPPMPPKTQTESLNTFFQSNDSLRHQRSVIMTFLGGLIRMPELMMFCPLVPQFFQLSRPQFVEWFGTVREGLATLKLVNGPIMAHSDNEGESGLLDNTGKMVKGAFTSVMSWFESSTDKPKKSKSELKAAIDDKIKNMVQYDRWARRLEVLREQKKAYSEAASEVSKYIVAREQELEALADVAAAFQDYGGKVLQDCNKFTDLSDIVGLEHSFLDGVGKAHTREPHTMERNVFETLMAETNWCAAAIEHINIMICLWKRLIELQIEKAGSPEADRFERFCMGCNDCLEDRCLEFDKLQRRRLAQLSFRHTVDAVSFLERSERAATDHQLPTVMGHPDFLTSFQGPEETRR